jgi:hypothetical protein
MHMRKKLQTNKSKSNCGGSMKITKEEFIHRFFKFINKHAFRFCPSDLGLINSKDCITREITCDKCIKQAIEQGVEK